MPYYNFQGFGAVPINQISTLQQAYEYAVAGAADAKTVCPSAASAYSAAASQISAKLVQADVSWFDDETAVQDAVALLQAANKKCTAAKQPTTTTTPTTSTTQKTPTTKPPQTIKTGLPWWAWGGLAFLGVMMLKKSKKKRTRKNPATRNRRGVSAAGRRGWYKRVGRRRATSQHGARTKIGMWRALRPSARTELTSMYGPYDEVPFAAIKLYYYGGR